MFGRYPVCLWAVFNLQRLLCLVIAHSAATEKHKLHSMYPGYCCDLCISRWHVEFVRWSMSFLKSFQKKFLRTKVREMLWLALLDMVEMSLAWNFKSYCKLWLWLIAESDVTLSFLVPCHCTFCTFPLSGRDSLHSPWHIVCFGV